MTGTAEITTLTREQALLVPNAALRFAPPSTGVTEKKSSGGVMGALMPRPPTQTKKTEATVNNGTPRVWVLRNGELTAIEVLTGATNGRVTEIKGGDIKAGMQVVIEALDTQP